MEISRRDVSEAIVFVVCAPLSLVELQSCFGDEPVKKGHVVCPPNGTAVLNSLKGVNACFWRNSDPKFVPGGVLSHHPRVIYDTWYMVYGLWYVRVRDANSLYYPAFGTYTGAGTVRSGVSELSYRHAWV